MSAYHDAAAKYFNNQQVTVFGGRVKLSAKNSEYITISHNGNDFISNTVVGVIQNAVRRSFAAHLDLSFELKQCSEEYSLMRLIMKFKEIKPYSKDNL